MVSVCLINPAQPELMQPTAYIPLGLAYIAAVVELASYHALERLIVIVLFTNIPSP